MSNMFEDVVRDEAKLREALADADIAPALMVLVQLSGDMAILDEVAPHIQGAWNYLETVPPALKQKVRDRLVDALKDYARSGRAAPALPDAATLRRMMSASVGTSVPEEYIPLFVEELRMGEKDTRELEWRRDPATLPIKDFRVVIVGAGFSGICAGIRLKQAGIPFVILERNASVGGTWYENSYPGCGVDTPNHFYSLSFSPNNDWSRHFSLRDEIHDYIEGTVDKFDLRRDIRFGAEVTGAEYREQDATWLVRYRTADGIADEIVCNSLITAAGHNVPSTPEIDGLDSFAGQVVHTGRWDRGIDLKGKRVAMIGTGASGMQAGPAIADEVASLVIFQRTPHWAMGNPNYHKPITEGHKWALNHIPFFSEWQRFQIFWAASDGFHASLHVDPAWPHLDRSLNKDNQKMRENITAYITNQLDGDEALLAKCIPSYPPYGKRMLRDNHWFKMLKKPHVELVTDSIARVTADGIVTSTGAVHEVDVIIMATGFQAAKLLWPMDIRGRDGVTIRSLWGDDDPRAYKGMAVPGFPNLFVIAGPNTSLSHGGSAVFHTECQVTYITKALREMIERGYGSIEVKPEVHDAYNRLVDEKHSKMVWTHRGVTSWYKNKHNRVTMTSPWRLVDFWQLTHEFVPAEYVCIPAPRRDPHEAGLAAAAVAAALDE
jgi:4-hydroxyacetophenone monooxygenase